MIGLTPLKRMARLRSIALDISRQRAHALLMITVPRVIALASGLFEEERGVVVDAIAPKESIAEVARSWSDEIDRRAARVRAGESKCRPTDEVFERIGAKLIPR